MLGTRTLIATTMAENEIKTLLGHVSNEAEDVSGRTSAEIERVIYARVTDFSFLERATDAERQEQWSIKVPKTEENAGSGSIRVRKVVNLRQAGSATQYVLTTKLDIGEKGSSAETPEQSTLDQFNVFKYLANKGMLKDRYVFPIEGTDLVWEVDCFPKPGEMYFEWVKIDLEKWPTGKELPQLPMAVAEMIDGDSSTQSPEAKAKISQLYQDVFLISNNQEPLATYLLGGNDQPGVAKEDPPPQTDPNAAPPEGTEGDGEGSDNASESGTANDDGDDTSKEGKKDSEEGNDGDNTDGKKPGFADDVLEATQEAFSSAGQVLAPLVPIIGPLLAVIHGQRSVDLGVTTTSQHTTKTTSHIDDKGHKTQHESKTGSFTLTDIQDAKDYIGLIEKAAGEVKHALKNIDRLEFTLWPQKDGRVGIFNIKTNRDGETQIFTENNPGALKWFSLSLAGKRMIKLDSSNKDQFKFNGRTISVPFDGRQVEFDVGQLRHLKYQTTPKNNSFDIVEYNFDV